MGSSDLQHREVRTLSSPVGILCLLELLISCSLFPLLLFSGRSIYEQLKKKFTNITTTINTNITNIIIMVFQFIVDIITIFSDLIKHIIEYAPSTNTSGLMLI